MWMLGWPRCTILEMTSQRSNLSPRFLHWTPNIVNICLLHSGNPGILTFCQFVLTVSIIVYQSVWSPLVSFHLFACLCGHSITKDKAEHWRPCGYHPSSIISPLTIHILCEIYSDYIMRLDDSKERLYMSLLKKYANTQVLFLFSSTVDEVF